MNGGLTNPVEAYWKTATQPRGRQWGPEALRCRQIARLARDLTTAPGSGEAAKRGSAERTGSALLGAGGADLLAPRSTTTHGPPGWDRRWGRAG